MKNIAIITARSGSKGLIDKNIKLLNDKPLMAYSIEAAINSRLFDEVFVSTDSKEYADIALKWGANVPFLRKPELSTDTTSSWDVVKDAIKCYREIGRDFDTMALLQPTSPLRKDYDIINGYNVMKEKQANSVVSVCEVDHSPLLSSVLPDDMSLMDFFNDGYNHPRQALPNYYRINGALYITKVDYLMNCKNIYEDKCYAVIMSKENSIDIDSELDFLVAGLLISRQ